MMNKLFKITGFIALFTALIVAALYAFGQVGSEAVAIVLFFEIVGVLSYAASTGGKHGKTNN